MKTTIFVTAFLVLLSTGCRQGKQPASGEKDYISSGKHIASITQDTLKKELFTAIQNRGIMDAVEYCKLNAEQITSIYEKENVAEISRTALRYRNPQNAPDSLELSILKKYERQIKTDISPEPETHIINNKVHYFQPIILKSPCLACHGTPGKEITPAVYAHIKNMYPTDMATGFRESELRGMWHIIFNE